MSHFTTIRTRFLDQDVLLDAIKHVMPKATVSIGSNQKITVSDSSVGIYNDICFQKKNGVYQVVTRDYYVTEAKSLIDRLTRVYAEKKVCKEMVSQGISIKNRIVMKDGTVELTMEKWR